MTSHTEATFMAHGSEAALYLMSTQTGFGDVRSNEVSEGYHESSELSGPMEELGVDLGCIVVHNGMGDRAKVVLNGLDLTLPKGKIYGLLGPSGCGKTTLLRCILGRKTPQKGSVQVLGKTPGRPGVAIPGPGVGYMPQELTLYPELTIYETLYFFGQLFGMTRPDIKQRIDDLVELLELPDVRSLVQFLSGGQQRRVSLACALIHAPPLLILDEPTVGLDPILIKKIWEHLAALTRDEGVTVLVTTHHMEEVREANIVGLMRSGRMLAQDSPDQLLEDNQCDTLGKVFLKLCIDDQEGRAIVKPGKIPEVVIHETMSNSANIVDPSHEKNTPCLELPPEVKTTLCTSKRPLDNRAILDIEGHDTIAGSLCRVYALVMKNLIQTWRNKFLILFALLAPPLHMFLFGYSIGGDPSELPFAVVNYDVHPILSEPFLDIISNRTIIQRRYHKLDDALESMKRGENWGVMEIGCNFSSALQLRFLLGIDTDNNTIRESTINVHMDSTNQQVRFIIQKTIFEAMMTLSEKLLGKNNKNIGLAKLPVKIRDPFYDEELSVTEFMAPGIILSIIFFMTMALTAVSTTREAREGTMERCLVAGVKSSEVIFSHVLSQICVMIVKVFLVLVMVFVVLKITLRGSLFLVASLTLLQGLSGMAYGLAISSICTQEQTAIFLALATFIANLLISGTIWPVQSMPEFLRNVAYRLPQTIPTESLRCIMYRGWGIERDEVRIGFLISIQWAAFFLFIAILLFKYGRNR